MQVGHHSGRKSTIGKVLIVGLLGGLGWGAGAANASPSSSSSTVTTVIRLKSQISMRELAEQVQNPNSSRYHQYFTSDEIRRLAAPSDKDYQNELGLLRREGFTIVKESPTHLWVTVRGEASSFEKTFSTSLEVVAPGRHRLKSAIIVPSHLKLVAGVTGLDNTRVLHPHMVFAPLAQALRKKKNPNPDPTWPPGWPGGDPGDPGDPGNPGDPGAPTGPTGPTTGPTDPNAIPGIPAAAIKAAYGFDKLYAQGLTGAGQHIAIATYSGFNLSDVTSAYKLLGLPSTPTVDIMTFNGDAAYDPQAAGETELDAQMSGMIAPGAAIHVFTSSTNGDAGEAQMFTAILDDGRANIVNYSWGGCEPGLTTQHQAEMAPIFQRALAQGVNIFVASGDSGSDTCQDGSNKADWPADSDSVVAVGGTSLDLTGSTPVETGWNKSGGGVSAIFSIPTWQNGVTSYNMRAYPDVSFNADPATGQAIYYSQGAGVAPTWVVVGGTSMASPQWAGFMALVGEARAKNNLKPVGYINPILYSPNAQSQKAFFDITQGNNGLYTAGPGWDAVTGFGSLNAPNMFTLLTTN